MRRPNPFLLPVLLAAACASSRSPAGLPPELTNAQRLSLQQAEKAYLADAKDFAGLRDALAEDPVTAFWLARIFVVQLVKVRGGREEAMDSQSVAVADVGKTVRQDAGSSDDQLLRAVAKVKNPIEVAAFMQLDALGTAAVPCIVHDLASNKQALLCQLGCELLGRLGSKALPLIEPLRTSPEVVSRRAYAQALGFMAPSQVPFAALRVMATDDGDFTVRAAAIKVLGEQDTNSQLLLRQRSVDDVDPFVRRLAAQGLARHQNRENALAVADFLARSMRERDSRGERAAQEALQQMAKTRGPRTLDQWRLFAQSLGSQDSK
ncbi:MAG: HEAT repeat domain-containing protein [Planctomycetota bacterium]|nr:HEAT repeat domain-containing protein [Planctomycetota bacterium]